LEEAARLAAAYPHAPWPGGGDELVATAQRLRRRLIDLCWVEEGRFFALGVDRDPGGRLRPLAIRTSNMGRLLDSNILDGEEWRPYREAVVDHLFGEELLAPGGIRTLAAGSARYRPGSYHNGSVWPFDTRLIARGLARHGHSDLAAELDRRLVAACQQVRCYPEFVRGDGLDINRHVVEVEDAEGRANRVEQPPQLFQAWTVAAYISATTA
jgi:glycogen debranching enzyme